MKVLAVIPARAGSKGIPNKNIRFLKGHPMIWYAINNALSSKYITDVIVSTDSDVIETICNEMSVKVRKRAENLCSDTTTLDSVIYDSCKDIVSDYVVTLQPTSPTLKTETLDAAIMYTISNNVDTVLSVINKPHLSWKLDESGKIVPDYKKRLNRQQLPPNFIETGAFVITKYNCVTPESRLGKNVDVFEISEEEAIDIDNFADMKIAEQYMDKEKVAFWVNGNNKIGLGHITRVLELADEFYVKPDIYYDYNITQFSYFGNTTHNLISVDGEADFIKYIKKNDYSLVINDVLDTDICFMHKLRKATNAVIVNIEDSGKGVMYSDCVINALYENAEEKNTFCGKNYYIVPKLFMLYEPIQIKEVKKIFICFGGADPQNYTERVLKIVNRKEYDKYNYIVVLGKAKDNVKKLMQYKKFNIEILYDVDNMPSLMKECDAAITSRGRTGYELAFLGIPTLAMAQNDREAKHTFISDKNGFIYIGQNPSDKEIEKGIIRLLNMDMNMRYENHKKMLKNNLRNGRQNIMKKIKGIGADKN